MKELTIKEMRQIVGELLVDFPAYHKDLSKKTDEQLMDTDLRREYEFCSIDFEDMLSAVYDRCGIEINYETLHESAFFDESTVCNFMLMCNGCK